MPVWGPPLNQSQIAHLQYRSICIIKSLQNTIMFQNIDDS